jgi:drug/metabolite transporter (DMT)-like permease
MSAQNNNPRGIVLVIIAMSLFAMQDALIKFVFEKSALYEIFFGRYVVASFLLFCFVVIAKKKVSLKTQYPFLTILRVVLHFLAFSAFFISLTFMPLATS